MHTFKRREEKRREERIATTIPAGFLLHISLAALPGQEDSDLCRRSCCGNKHFLGCRRASSLGELGGP